MSRELLDLRGASQLMRARAAGATPGPWSNRRGPGEHIVRTDTGAPLANTDTRADRRHIASWHPVVALAVAASLDTAARDLWAHGPLCCEDGCIECDDSLWMPHVRQALAVARAYLGEGGAS